MLQFTRMRFISTARHHHHLGGRGKPDWERHDRRTFHHCSLSPQTTKSHSQLADRCIVICRLYMSVARHRYVVQGCDGKTTNLLPKSSVGANVTLCRKSLSIRVLAHGILVSLTRFSMHINI